MWALLHYDDGNYGLWEGAFLVGLVAHNIIYAYF